jgi:putative ABC transport system substrate-binding protein
MRVIGFLGLASPGPYAPYVAAFLGGLGEAGYIEGRNVAIEYHWADGQQNKLPELAADLVARKVAVMFAAAAIRLHGPPRRRPMTIPMVFLSGGELVKSGLVASINRPGGNLTGVNLVVGDLDPKRLALLRELVPDAVRIAFLTNPRNVNWAANVKAVQEAARGGPEILVLEASTVDAFDIAFSTLAERRADALLVDADSSFNANRDRLVSLAARYRVPAVYEWREFVTTGGLMSYGPSLTQTYRQIGIYAGKILDGANPAELP